MDLGLKGKTALVTGASKGIGLAVAQALAAEGARVALVSRDREALAAAAEGIGRAGGEAVAIPGDVSKAEDVERVVAKTRERLGDAAVLVANAGGPPSGVPTELDDAAWRAAVDLTLMSAVRLGRAVLPAMRADGWGRIVNITSLSVKEPILNLTLSNALRSGVTAWAKTLAEEIAADGVTVNNVEPGFTGTERLQHLFPTEEAMRGLVARIPAGRLGRPEEVAATVAFLASEQAAYMTGQSLLVDGGVIRAL
ncbi:MAG TPA: SDR family oxidoreductase [Trueperaceae bacterium]|nr:SDR family oxidoreductase [Trueperaceae bacterium]